MKPYDNPELMSLNSNLKLLNLTAVNLLTEMCVPLPSKSGSMSLFTVANRCRTLTSSSNSSESVLSLWMELKDQLQSSIDTDENELLMILHCVREFLVYVEGSVIGIGY
jgi:hypothetical protein